MAPAEALDASVAVKWFNPEPLREKALRMRRLFLEGKVANALRYNPRFGVEEVKSALKSLKDLQLILHELESGLAEAAVDEAYRLGITFYDGCYVALAKLRSVVMYTADAEVVARASSPSIRHLSEFLI